jgi:hypothetical protein
MTNAKLLGYDGVTGRELFVLELDKPEDLPDKFSLGGRKFVCLVVWDAHGIDPVRISMLARKLLDAGVVHVSAWGPDCERVHDIFDEEAVGGSPPQVPDHVVMTTWHADETLADAIWFTLRCSWPDDAYEVNCVSTLGLTIGVQSWAEEVRSAFLDPEGFSARLVNEDYGK